MSERTCFRWPCAPNTSTPQHLNTSTPQHLNTLIPPCRTRNLPDRSRRNCVLDCDGTLVTRPLASLRSTKGFSVLPRRFHPAFAVLVLPLIGFSWWVLPRPTPAAPPPPAP